MGVNQILATKIVFPMGCYTMSSFSSINHEETLPESINHEETLPEIWRFKTGGFGQNIDMCMDQCTNGHMNEYHFTHHFDGNGWQGFCRQIRKLLPDQWL